MNRVKKAKKSSYLLLELLLAFFILSLFLAPMLSSPFSYMRKQIKDMTSIYLQLEEEKLLFRIEEDLRTGKISWKSVISSEEGPTLLETRPVKVPGNKHQYEAKLFLIQGNFKEQEDIHFGTVKAAVKIFQVPHKKTQKKPATLSLFVLKKQTTAPHAPTK